MIRLGFWPILLTSFTFLYFCTATVIAVLLGIFCKQGQDYPGSDQSKHVAFGLNFHLNFKESETINGEHNNKTIYTNRKIRTKPMPQTPEYVFNNKNLTGDRSCIMWGNISFSPGKSKTPSRQNTSLRSPSIINGRSKLNSTMPVQVPSPLVPRQRRVDTSSDRSMLSAAGPLLSSPFMPQIKRALGLEPKTQLNYSQRRLCSSLNNSVVLSPSSPGALPHVRLNKSTRLSLTDKNSSMLNRPSTVKIAPPLPGKVASPSLHQMRNTSIVTEDRSTPDTYAVISALKERRKRSINSYEETQEHPVPQAKRRRQESQQSNASTSSMPSLPDNLPDLSSADFSMRLETPGIKRPSRPSNDDSDDWSKEIANKRPRGDMRNNSILSSLSSSQRFINMQMNKRKASNSFSEKENERSPMSKTKRQDPPKLTHLDMMLDNEKTQVNDRQQLEFHKKNGNGPVEVEKIDVIRREDKTKDSGSPMNRLPSMKKTASIYSGLGNVGSFRKAQYANVVATIDDYDSDREAEQNRVKQMLKDIDSSFSETKAKEAVDTTTTSGAVNGTVTVLTSSMAATSSTTTTSPSTASVLSVLEKLSKSPTGPGPSDKDQKTNGFNLSTPTVTKASVTSVDGQTSALGSPIASPSDSRSKADSLPSYSAAMSLISSTGSQSVAVSSASATPGLTVNGTQSATTTAAGLGIGQAVGSVAAVSVLGPPASTSLPTPSFAGFGSTSLSTKPASSLAVGFTFGAATSTTSAATTTVSASVSQVGGFSFGSALTSSAPSTSSVGNAFGAGASSAATTVTTAAPAGGFSFGTSTSASVLSTNNQTSSGLAFGVLPSSTPSSGMSAFGTPSTSTQAFSGFGMGASVGGGLSFGVSTSSAPSTVTTAASGFGSVATSTAGFSQISTPATSGFSFGSGSSATVNSATTIAGTTASAPFNFGVNSTGGYGATPATTSIQGFSFGASQGTNSASSTFGAPPSTTGFTFGTSQSTSTTGTAFGTQSSTIQSGFKFGSSQGTSAAPAPFGVSTSTTQSGFNFGTSSVTNTAPALFGAPTSTTQSGFPFGTSQGASATPAPFGASTSTAPAPFGASTSTAPAPFGASTSTTQSGFTFGASQGTSLGTTPFGATPSTTQSVFPFGANASTTSSGSAPFSFGAGSNQSVASPFGASTQTQQSAASTFNFGKSTTQNGGTPGVFSFGNSAVGTSNQTPAFGTSNQTPAFGAGSTNQTPAFGAGSTNQTSAFGSSNQLTTPAFGTGAGNSSGLFGNAIGTSPTFGKSHSMPSFGTVESSGGLGFSGQPAPNVNPFASGQTTPAKQTGSAFGQISSDTTPKQQTGALFQFGNQPNTNSSANQGFNFSAAAANTNQNTGGFNFTSTTTAFGTPTATPTPGAFAVGTTGESARPPRIVSKARRRGQRR